ncbi:MAG: DUF5916 domain-containing protein [Gammaproteobacteria bacterium]|nr:DUF5916 domain-containing protein [Gammaproteobacteria bacterium]
MKTLLSALVAAMVLFLTCQHAHAETTPTPQGELRLVTDGEAILVPRYDAVDIAIDGKLEEPIWQEVAGYDNMVVVEPETLVPTRFRTVARFLYTDRGLYIGVWNEQPPETLISRLSSRDEDISRDGWGITLDTTGEGLYGYWFTVNLGGSVMDGKVLPERNLSSEWDGPWHGATAMLPDGWSAELFLPWSMMTMPPADGERIMGFFARRRVAYINERWGWPALPLSGARFMSALQPMKVPDVAPKRQFNLFPYASAALDNRDGDNDWSAGVDVFWRPSPNFQVTATALPDFGAVESDDAVINLTARETYFPDKRLFFVEGSEIFNTSGRSAAAFQRRSRGASSQFSGARPTISTSRRPPSSVLNTRRIGGAPILTYDDDLDIESHRLSQPTDLLGAAKVVGQTGSMRYGMLAAFEDDPTLPATATDETGATIDTAISGEGRNFGVARVLFERSGDGRQSFGYIGTHVAHPLHRATVHGIDAQFLSAGGRWRAELQSLASDVRCTPVGEDMKRRPACPDDVNGSQRGYGVWADVDYTPRPGLRHTLRVDMFDEHLNINDLGFLGRNDQYGALYTLSLVQPNVFGLRRLGSRISVGQFTNSAGQATLNGAFLMNAFTFRNESELRVTLRYFPVRWEDLESRGHGAYRVHPRKGIELSFGTDTSKTISVSAQWAALSEDLGGMGYTWGGGFTFKPADRFSVDLDVNYRERDGWLQYVFDEGDFATFSASDLQPKLAMDFFITARQQLRLTMQWAGIRANEQELLQVIEGMERLQPRVREDGAESDDFTISRLIAQLRYRWEIAPLSDLFVVYTRGSNLANAYDLDDPFAIPRDSFGQLYRDAFADPLVDLLVVKLRYRFGR